MSAATHDTLKALVERMKQLQDWVAETEEAVKKVKEELDGLRLIRIPNEMERLELRSTTFEGLGRVQLAADLYCSVKAGCKDQVNQWLTDQGLEDMIIPTVNSSSLKALVRRRIAEGVEVPEFLNVTPFTRASIVKA